MYSRNIHSLLEYLVRDARLVVAVDDPIAGPMCLAHGGTVPTGR
jgi:NAD/NADP transhydrogenase alpha subunit